MLSPEGKQGAFSKFRALFAHDPYGARHHMVSTMLDFYYADMAVDVHRRIHIVTALSYPPGSPVRTYTHMQLHMAERRAAKKTIAVQVLSREHPTDARQFVHLQGALIAHYQQSAESDPVQHSFDDLHHLLKEFKEKRKGRRICSGSKNPSE